MRRPRYSFGTPARCVLLLLLLALAANAAPQCQWTVRDPGAVTAARLDDLCARLNCTRRCPTQCLHVRPPATLVVPSTPAADAAVARAFGDTDIVRTCHTSPLHLAHATTRRTTAADGDGNTSALDDYDVIVAPWAVAPDRAPAPIAAELVAQSHGGCERVALVSRELALLRATRCARAGADALAAHPDVLVVRPRARVRVSNEWTDTWFAHEAASGVAAAVNWDTHPPDGLPRWAGLDGAGQVIGHIDTGADLASAYLRDPVVSLPPYVPCAADGAGGPDAVPGGVPVAYADRRKVVQYVWDARGTGGCGADGAALDASDGHGTHTAGTAAGAADCDPFACAADVARFDGHAPGARLAVFDAGPDADGHLQIPADVGDSALAWATAAGAHVHVNSWGAQTGGLYDVLDYAFDAYADAHPEALLVVAAGNAGAAGGAGAAAAAVSSPALAKNALSVGALVSTGAAGDAAFCGADALVPNAPMCALLGTDNAAGSSPQNVAYFSAHGVLSSARRAKPDLVAPGYFTFSAANAQPPAGASGSADAAADAGAPNAWRAGTVTALAGTSMATPAVAALAALVRQYFAQGWWPCGYAGAGAPWTRVSAALVKAVLIASARELTGVQWTDPAGLSAAGARPIGVAAAGLPNAFQGYGAARAPGAADNGVRVAALRAWVAPLALPALDAGALPDGVAAERAFAVTGESATWEVCVWAPYAASPHGTAAWPARSLRAALVWTDPPAVPTYTAAADLVNDLDLSVWDAQTDALVALGNDEIAPAATGPATRTSPTTQPDTSSNVEVAVLRGATATAPGRRLRVQVTASRILAGPQRFALVLAGGWGACNASAAQRCETACNASTCAPVLPPATPAPPLDRAFVPAALYAAVVYASASRPCVPGGMCTSAADASAARIEAVVGFATPAADGAAATAPPDTLVRVRAVADPAALAPDDATAWPAGGTRLSWALRVTLPRAADGAGAPVYVSLPAAEAAGGIVSARQRLVVRAVAPDNATAAPAQAAAAALGWVPAAGAALRAAADERTAVSATALRVTGTSAALPALLANATDTLWALQTLPDDGDSAVLCAHALYGCTCTRHTAHGFETPAWRPAVALLACVVAAAAIVLDALQVFAPDDDDDDANGDAKTAAVTARAARALRARAGGYARLSTARNDGDTDAGIAEAAQRAAARAGTATAGALLTSAALPVNAAVLLVASVRAETATAATIAWAGAAALGAVYTLVGPLLTRGGTAAASAAAAATAATAAQLVADAALLAGPLTAAAVLGADAMLLRDALPISSVYVDVYTLTAALAVTTAVSVTVRLVAPLASTATTTPLVHAALLLTLSAWTLLCGALAARLSWQTQASVAAVGGAFTLLVHGWLADASPDAVSRVATWAALLPILASAYVILHAPCEP